MPTLKKKAETPFPRVLLSSTKQDWGTPDWLFDILDEEFCFSLDTAARADNTKCSVYFDEKADGLKQPWNTDGTAWCNPPYGRKVGAWVEKAYNEGVAWNPSVLLLPARVDTKWFHKFAGWAEVRLLKGRILFQGAKQGATFPSMLMRFGPGAKRGTISTITYVQPKRKKSEE